MLGRLTGRGGSCGEARSVSEGNPNGVCFSVDDTNFVILVVVGEDIEF